MSKNDTEGEKISKSHQEVVGAGGEYELVSSEGAVAAAEAHVAQALRLQISSLQREYAFYPSVLLYSTGMFERIYKRLQDW